MIRKIVTVNKWEGGEDVNLVRGREKKIINKIRENDIIDGEGK